MVEDQCGIIAHGNGSRVRYSPLVPLPICSVPRESVVVPL